MKNENNFGNRLLGYRFLQIINYLRDYLFHPVLQKLSVLRSVQENMLIMQYIYNYVVAVVSTCMIILFSNVTSYFVYRITFLYVS